MMDVRHFYGGRRRRIAERCTNVFDAVNKATTSANAVSIVVLPPTAGDTAADSDTEQVPGDMSNENMRKLKVIPYHMKIYTGK